MQCGSDDNINTSKWWTALLRQLEDFTSGVVKTVQGDKKIHNAVYSLKSMLDYSTHVEYVVCKISDASTVGGEGSYNVHC